MELVGDIDVAVSSEVEALVPLVVAGDPTQVDIELRSVSFIDLGGLRAVGCLANEQRRWAPVWPVRKRLLVQN